MSPPQIEKPPAPRTAEGQGFAWLLLRGIGTEAMEKPSRIRAPLAAVAPYEDEIVDYAQSVWLYLCRQPTLRAVAPEHPMRVYTVRKLGPNTDREFQAYVDLLEEIGINIADVPRTPEPGTQNRWLYVWKERKHADRFARELGARLHDSSWHVHEIEIREEERGSLAPLTIRSMPTPEGTYFRLDPQSQERVMRYFPNVKLSGVMKLPKQVLFPSQVRDDYERQHGPVWDQVIIILIGLPEEAIERLGGVRIVGENGEVLHERLPTVRPR